MSIKRAVTLFASTGEIARDYTAQEWRKVPYEV